MAISYEMVIKEVETVSAYGIDNIVRRVHWNMEATDSTTGLKGVVRNVDVFEVVDFTYENTSTNENITVPADFNPNDYTPYAELTKDLIEGWIASKLGDDAMSRFRATALRNLQEKISKQASNTQPTPLPWV